VTAYEPTNPGWRRQYESEEARAVPRRIRGRNAGDAAERALKQITLQVGVEQIAEARRVAAQTGLKYQAVLRRWLAEGASIARTRRVASGRKL
jgi:hypothetical protein